jgi:hypothetical protein
MLDVHLKSLDWKLHIIKDIPYFQAQAEWLALILLKPHMLIFENAVPILYYDYGLPFPQYFAKRNTHYPNKI